MPVLSTFILRAIHPPAHAVLDAIIDDKIQLLVGKAIMFCQNLVDLVSKTGTF